MAKARILIVDDDPSIRESLRRILDYEDYAVRTAEDGPSALEILNDILGDGPVPAEPGRVAVHVLVEHAHQFVESPTPGCSGITAIHTS